MNTKWNRILLLLYGVATSSASFAHDHAAAAPGMSHHASMHSSAAASKQPYDLQFLDTMAHHPKARSLAPRWR